MDGGGIAEIAGRLCVLLDEQMRALARPASQILSDEEVANYELRRKQIAALHVELNALAGSAPT
jgi:hypothetical protein